ncbi:hypothetical protein DPSP01_013824 [Paraphaeosphaeria sporulosa]|uniref:Uncharacterized protein n=1 Tax=Paraphaeosphaeria sporulosa TaxID=1460663 RepID=A0A177CH57_9PLEO|nr:uncharacterized protein CC84DRAFT_753933 [Paraphaeosphaeria sporulosa]OAG06179.1 hypothetical protein CC84DRAFT_753933 [Paraphaeosphaeria sporulosa]
MYGYPQAKIRAQRDNYDYDYNCQPRLGQRGHENGYQRESERNDHRRYRHSRDRPNDIEEATRAHVKASKDYDDAKAKYQEYRRKYENARKKLDEATAPLSAAKRREGAW